jgi:hypothetical protein
MSQFISNFGYDDEVLFKLNLLQSYRGKIVSWDIFSLYD